MCLETQFLDTKTRPFFKVNKVCKKKIQIRNISYYKVKGF